MELRFLKPLNTLFKTFLALFQDLQIFIEEAAEGVKLSEILGTLIQNFLGSISGSANVY
jgi:hypothetical protein